MTITADSTELHAVKDNVKIDFAKAKGSTTPAYNASSKQLRAYASNTFTFSTVDGSAITGIVITFDTTAKIPALTAAEGTFELSEDKTTGTWTGNVASVTFTVDSASGTQARMTNFSVTTE